MLLRRHWRLLLAAVLVLLLLLAGWYAYLAYKVADDLNAAVDDAEDARAALTAGETERATALLDDVAERSRSAADRTSGLSWSAATVLPLVGDDASGVRTASQVVADLADSGLAEIIEAADSVDALAPQDGRVDLDLVADLQAPLAEAADALAEADAKLAEEDSSGFLGRLRTQYDELAAAISDAAGILDTASTAADVMPVMLGADEPRSYLLVFQNNAEARASGGLPGSAAVLTADEGRLSLERQFAGAAFGARDEPILPLTSAELQLYGPLLGTDFRDANFTPDFARAAELWSARWEEEFPADTLDGVATLDTVALSYLMRGMDPLEVQGVTLTADNVVEELLAEVYERFEQPALQDAFFQEVATTVFTEAVGGGVAPRELLPALRDAADEGRALVTVDDPVVLERLGDAQILGPDLEGERDADTYFVAVNATTSGKLTYYLRFRSRLNTTYCSDGRQASTLNVSLESQVPEDAASLPEYVLGPIQKGYEPGEQSVKLRLFTPHGGQIGQGMRDGAPTDVRYQQQGDRVVAEVVIALKPGESVEYAFRTVAPGRDTAGVWTTPTIDGPGGLETKETGCE